MYDNTDHELAVMRQHELRLERDADRGYLTQAEMDAEVEGVAGVLLDDPQALAQLVYEDAQFDLLLLFLANRKGEEAVRLFDRILMSQAREMWGKRA